MFEKCDATVLKNISFLPADKQNLPYWCIFTWLIDIFIQNAWVIHKKCEDNMRQFEFKSICNTMAHLQNEQDLVDNHTCKTKGNEIWII